MTVYGRALMRPLPLARAGPRAGLPPAAVLLAACALSACVAWLLMTRPLLAYLPAALLAGLALLVDGRLRLLVLVGGGLLVLQTSNELTTTKLAYLAAVAVAGVGALLRLPRLQHTPAFRMIWPLLVGSAVFAAVAAVSFLVATAHGVPQRPWLRDIAPYFLVASAPLFALDAHASFGERALRRILVVAGTIGTVSYALSWLHKRGIAELPLSRLALPTFLLGAALIAYCIAAAYEGRRWRLLWAVLAVGLITALVFSGSRLVLVLSVLGAPIAVTLASPRGLLRRSLKLALVAPFAAALAAVALYGGLQTTGADREALEERTQLLLRTGTRRDQSYRERALAGQAAWREFRSSPLVGTGPGAELRYRGAGVAVEGVNLDTPVAFLAKFGLLGVAGALALVLGYFRFARHVRRRDGPVVAHLALVGYAGIVAAWSVLQLPFEDKGFAMALVLLIAVGLAERLHGDSDPAPPRAAAPQQLQPIPARPRAT